MPTDDSPQETARPVGPHGEPLRPQSAASLASAPLPYMRWAKAHLSWEALGPGTICLGMSGLTPLSGTERGALGMPPLPEVGTAAADLKAALATHHGVAPAHVALAAGTSHANFVTYLALARGGAVAVEAPAYEALPRLAPAVGASCSPFARDPARDWRVDPASLAAAVNDTTDLIVVTDLHNPSGMRLDSEDLDLLLRTAERHDAFLLVDEVYADFDPEPRPTAALRDPRIITTNSLTKAHGLPDLRCGWILGSPEVLERIAGWDDLVHPALPPAPMIDAAIYVPQARALLEATRERAATCSALVDAWVEATPRVSWSRPTGGLTGFLLLDGLDGDRVAERAWTDHSVRIVPGSFFQCREGLRISFLLPEDELTRALDGLARAVEACA